MFANENYYKVNVKKIYIYDMYIDILYVYTVYTFITKNILKFMYIHSNKNVKNKIKICKIYNKILYSKY